MPNSGLSLLKNIENIDFSPLTGLIGISNNFCEDCPKLKEVDLSACINLKNFNITEDSEKGPFYKSTIEILKVPYIYRPDD